MGDAVRRVQRHLQALARDNFARLEIAHSTNVDWLRAELAALAQDVNVPLRVELKRPLPATFRRCVRAFASLLERCVRH